MKRGKCGFAPDHTMIQGDANVSSKPKPYSIKVVRVGNRSDEIVRELVKSKLEKVLEKNGAVAYNLDEVLHKYISVGPEET